MSEKQKCPVCEGTQIAIERRINGNRRCQNCGHEWPNRRIDIEAALAERDAEIARLREENSKLKSEILEHDLVECECNDGTCGICELNKALEKDNE